MQLSRQPHEVVTSLRRSSQSDGTVGAVRILGRLDRLLIQAGTAASVWWALLAMAACTALAAAWLRLLSGLPAAPAPMLACALGVGLPVLDLMLRGARRRSLLEEQLPGALELMTKSLQAGDPLSSALAAVAREMPDPIGSEFGIVVDEITYGRAPDAALLRLSERIDLPALGCLAIAVRIQSSVDGDLAEALDGLATAMHDRFHTSGGR
jgi:tight adherence protein B